MLRFVEAEPVQTQHELVPERAGPLPDEPDVQPAGEERQDPDDEQLDDRQFAEPVMVGRHRDRDDARDRHGEKDRGDEVLSELLDVVAA